MAIQLTRLANSARQSAVLKERNRLAAEIHDSLAQNFAGIFMQLSAAADAMKINNKDALSHVERATDLAHFGLSEARRSALNLRSDVIEKSGLIEALRMLAERSNIPGRLRSTFSSSGVREEILAPQVQQDLFRIAQEALSNAVRHANPTVVTVTLRWDPPNLILQVKDNGSGITKARLEKNDGVGLDSMRERAAQMAAKLEIETAAGQGTSIIVTVPMRVG